MREPDDIGLLRDYGWRHSEDAFAAIVRRYVNLVYSVAFRSVANSDAAEEITQAVFIILARKARSLSRGTVLSGWLYRTARLTAGRFLRTEIRRQNREREAYMQSLANESEPQTTWPQIAPLLDAAMDRLGKKDREALVLRYFENKKLREVGMALGASEAAAKMRVNRALEKLRRLFAERGVTFSGGAIAAAVSANSVHAGPPGLAQAVSAVAVAKGAAASGSTLALVKGALKGMAWSKAKASIVVGATAIALTLGTAHSGWFGFGTRRLPVGAVPPVIALGKGFGILLASDGSLWAWGEQDIALSPVLGLKNVNRTTALRRIGTGTNWTDIAVSDHSCVAIKSDGTLWGWGQDIEGAPASSDTPVQIFPGTDWKQVAVGYGGLAIKRDGTLWAWGENSAGQLGIGGATQASDPVQVGASTNWVRIWSSSIQTVGLQSDGSLWFCGALRGPKPEDIIRVPTRVSSDTDWVDVSIGWYTVFAVKSDGTLWCFGDKAGIYSQTPGAVTLNPKQIGTGNDWKTCASYGGFYTVLMKKDGSLWTLDYNQGTMPTIRGINLHEDIVALAACMDDVGVALSRDGAVWTWGTVFGEHSPDYMLRCYRERLRPKFTIRHQPWRLAVVSSGS
jgi:RNA polymerase sigma factor (sigma-70 family)